MVDIAREEPIRRLPVWLARLANRMIGWTTDACSGGCGYPITRRFNYELEVIGDAHVVMLICSLGGECERVVSSDPRDEIGRSYADFRPSVVDMLRSNPETRLVALSHTV